MQQTHRQIQFINGIFQVKQEIIDQFQPLWSQNQDEIIIVPVMKHEDLLQIYQYNLDKQGTKPLWKHLHWLGCDPSKNLECVDFLTNQMVNCVVKDLTMIQAFSQTKDHEDPTVNMQLIHKYAEPYVKKQVLDLFDIVHLSCYIQQQFIQKVNGYIYVDNNSLIAYADECGNTNQMIKQGQRILFQIIKNIKINGIILDPNVKYQLDFCQCDRLILMNNEALFLQQCQDFKPICVEIFLISIDILMHSQVNIFPDNFKNIQSIHLYSEFPYVWQNVFKVIKEHQRVEHIKVTYGKLKDEYFQDLYGLISVELYEVDGLTQKTIDFIKSQKNLQTFIVSKCPGLQDMEIHNDQTPIWINIESYLPYLENSKNFWYKRGPPKDNYSDHIQYK